MSITVTFEVWRASAALQLCNFKPYVFRKENSVLHSRNLGSQTSCHTPNEHALLPFFVRVFHLFERRADQASKVRFDLR